ncbi:MAG: carboxymuconolactone decarboxylase family protein [Nitrospiraceae bacterium]|nr:carboxymuconolactone decarboxylase family protein [Nitrospiraceae bacterium]
MEMKDLPRHYKDLRNKFPGYFAALEALGREARVSGPLDEKTVELLQLAAAAAVRSEGALHSHARRALAAGASTEELYQALLALTSTIGFPAVAASASWLEDVIKGK